MVKPYFQVELDALAIFHRVAQLAGIPKPFITDGMNELWAHCYREQVEELTQEELFGFFPDSPRLVKALATYGFIEVLGKLVRVKGVDRYRRVKEVRSEAGKKGGKARSEAPRVAGRFVKADKALQPSTTQMSGGAGQRARQVSGASVVSLASDDGPMDVDPPQSTKRKPLAHNGPTAAPPSVTTQMSGEDTSVTTQMSGGCVEALVSQTTQNQPFYPRAESLSPSERETLREGAPAQRESHAPPPEGAGRDSRTGTSEGTRGEMAAVPESPAPAPAGPSPKDPVPADRWRLWLPEQLPSPTPPPESEWANAMAWRLMRLTRFAENARPRDYAHLAEQQRVTEELYRDVCDELAPRVTEYQGLALLYHLDDRLAESETDTPAKLMRWLRSEARPQEAMSDAVH